MDAAELLHRFKSAAIISSDDWETAEVYIHDQLSVIVPLPDKSYGPAARELIREVLTALKDMDNDVREVCLAHQKKSRFRLPEFNAALKGVSFEKPDFVVLSYYSYDLDSDWDESFTKSGDRWTLVPR
ncbi:hypothetical protein OKA05_01485 [Luteolibacter arcticus]|uniref:SnoaL-like domain-containing protein n=1 Tax=Luteolibacter arcticus TaxID=1581411 RepID=A0ABT3GDW3_9BACT|nr:hypothetical protein [Luteolibacter arcticus]